MPADVFFGVTFTSAMKSAIASELRNTEFLYSSGFFLLAAFVASKASHRTRFVVISFSGMPSAWSSLTCLRTFFFVSFHQYEISEATFLLQPSGHCVAGSCHGNSFLGVSQEESKSAAI